MLKRLFLSVSVMLTVLAASSCSKKAGSKETEAAVPVEVAQVGLGDVVQSITYQGDVRAEFEVKVFSKIPDRIEAFYKDAGDAVAQGAPIAKIYATSLEQGVKQAEAGLSSAKAQEANMSVEIARAERLFNENAMSKQQYDGIQTQYQAVKAQLDQAQAAVTSIRDQLADAVVKAPIAGIVGKRYYEAGDMASPMTPIVSIVQMNRVKILFNATDVDLGRLSLGQKAAVVVRSLPNEKFDGRVSKISPVLDPMTRMAEVEVLVANPRHRLKPGMYAQAEVVTGIMKKMIVVPRHSVVESTSLERQDGEDRVVNNYYVFVINKDRAEQRKLDVLYVNHKQIAVAGGVRAGEQIAVSGQNNLRDGSTVSVVGKESAGL
jgi:RND family efflux transporter MFP subunit